MVGGSSSSPTRSRPSTSSTRCSRPTPTSWDGSRTLGRVSHAIPFPGPAFLGRGVVATPGDDLPPEADSWPRITIDETALERASETAAQLRARWLERTPSVVRLAVPFARLRNGETTDVAPHDLTPRFSFHLEAIHFLIWANRYDTRAGKLVWHHTDRATTLGAEPGPATDVVTADGSFWIDGGPRRPLPGVDLIHVNQIWGGSLRPDQSGGWAVGDALDESQHAAIHHPGGPARIIAPAGSGKTRVLTARLRHLVNDRGWDPGGITAVAYNVRAAQEMKDRTTDLAGASISTLHSLGYRIIGDARGRRPPVLDEREIRTILGDLVPGRPRAGEDLVAPYIEALDEVRDGLVPPDDVEMSRDDVPGFAEVFHRYRDRLAASGAIDHPEQIYGAVEHLLRDPDLRTRYQQRARHLLVDEFQDLTPARLLMIRLIAGPAADVFGVGDDDQVIYGHAGADPDFLIGYDGYFPGATAYELSTNYRSPPDVTAAASTLLTHNRMRVPKTTKSGRPDAETGMVVIRTSSPGIGDELVGAVEGLVAKGHTPADIAVLTRVNVGLLAPQILLADVGTAVRSVISTGLMDRSGVRSVMSWLRLGHAAAYEERLGGPDLGEALRRPPRRISPGLRGVITSSGWQLDRLSVFASDNDNDRLRNRMEGFVDDIYLMRDVVADGTTADALIALRDRVGLGTALDRLDRSKGANPVSHGDDLAALIQIAHLQPDPALFEGWLREHLTRPSSPDGVTLSTVHRVKGLEWPAVVVWDVTDEVFPHRLSTGPTQHEEERRVFHVAITRGIDDVIVLGRDDPQSPYPDEMTTAAPPAPALQPDARAGMAVPGGIEAELGRTVSWQGFHVKVAHIEEKGARVKLPTGATLLIGWGERVESGGAHGSLLRPQPDITRPSIDDALLDRLREWRLRRATTDGVPAYVIAHDRHLEAIAAARPTTLDELADCDGIGPSRLERYGEDILDVIETE